MKTFEQIMVNPTCCHAAGCERESELLLHLAVDPPGYADLCMPHARGYTAITPLLMTCRCDFCERARKAMAAHEHVGDVVLCPDCQGRWLVHTESGSTHLMDLDAKTIQRVQDEGRDDAGLDFASVRLRRDGDVLPLLAFEAIRVGEPAYLHIGEVDDYLGYVSTTRATTPVRSVEEVR